MVRPVAQIPSVVKAWPILGHSPRLLRQRHEFFVDARKAGPIATVHIGRRRTYLVNDLGLMRQVLKTDANDYGKGELFARLRPYFGNGLSLADGREHRKNRRIIRPAFSHSMIDGYLGEFAESTRTHLGSWQSGQQRNLHDEFYELVLEFAGKAFFSGGLGQPVMDTVRASLPDLIRGTFLRIISPARGLEHLPLPVNRRFETATTRIRDAFDNVVRDYRTSNTRHQGIDLLSILLAARDPDTGDMLGDEQIRAELLSATLAGAVTTASALGWCCHLSSTHLEVQRRVQAEVDSVLGDAPCTLAHIKRLTYVGRVVREALRLYPPVHFLTRSPIREVVLGGYRIPAGSTVLMSFYALHRDPELYPNPDQFDPDRWGDTAERGAPADAYLPFGAGMHGCIGEPLALADKHGTDRHCGEMAAFLRWFGHWAASRWRRAYPWSRSDSRARQGVHRPVADPG